MKKNLLSSIKEFLTFIGSFLWPILKFLLKILGGVLFVIGVNGVNILLTVTTGAVCGWLLDVCLQRPILEFMTTNADVTSIYFQQIGAVAGFIIGFFRHDFKINLKQDKNNTV